MNNIIIFIIKFYQKVIYPILKPVFPSSCRFTPTCSEYTVDSIKKYGIIKGCYLGFRRVLSCNPWFN